MTKIEEAITEHWGERCADYHHHCPCCQAWGEYDTMLAYKDRLEINPEFPEYDGIACRDETIRQLEAKLSPPPDTGLDALVQSSMPRDFEQRYVTDSGMDGDAIEQAELLWANLPTGREWASLATHEKALVCHAINRLRIAREVDVERVVALEEAVGILEDALQEVGDDYPGSSCQQWCQQQVKLARAAMTGEKSNG